MEKQTYGSVVAMEFRRKPDIDFANIVEEFDIAFQMVDSRTRALTWDCDDIAIIDRDVVRVALGWLPAKRERDCWHLIVAVGGPANGTDTIDPASYRFLADKIVERARDYLDFSAVLHGEANQPVSAELMDTLFELLRVNSDEMPTDRRRAPARAAEKTDEAAETMRPPWMGETPEEPASPGFEAEHESAEGLTNQMGQLLLTRAEPTQPLRLTIHTLALSLCLYVPALGAAMFAYTMLRDVFPVAAV